MELRAGIEHPKKTMELLIEFAQLKGDAIEFLKSSMNIGKLRSELHGNIKTLGALALNHVFLVELRTSFVDFQGVFHEFTQKLWSFELQLNTPKKSWSSELNLQIFRQLIRNLHKNCAASSWD